MKIKTAMKKIIFVGKKAFRPAILAFIILSLASSIIFGQGSTNTSEKVITTAKAQTNTGNAGALAAYKAAAADEQKAALQTISDLSKNSFNAANWYIDWVDPVMKALEKAYFGPNGLYTKTCSQSHLNTCNADPCVKFRSLLGMKETDPGNNDCILPASTTDRFAPVDGNTYCYLTDNNTNYFIYKSVVAQKPDSTKFVVQVSNFQKGIDAGCWTRGKPIADMAPGGAEFNKRIDGLDASWKFIDDKLKAALTEVNIGPADEKAAFQTSIAQARNEIKNAHETAYAAFSEFTYMVYTPWPSKVTTQIGQISNDTTTYPKEAAFRNVAGMMKAAIAKYDTALQERAGWLSGDATKCSSNVTSDGVNTNIKTASDAMNEVRNARTNLATAFQDIAKERGDNDAAMSTIFGDVVMTLNDKYKELLGKDLDLNDKFIQCIGSSGIIIQEGITNSINQIAGGSSGGVCEANGEGDGGVTLIGHPICKFLWNLADTLGKWVDSMLKKILNVLDVHLGNDPQVVAGWTYVRGIINTLFILALLAIAVMNTLRIEPKTWDFRRMIPMLALSIILVNFSLTIAQFIIDFATALTSLMISQAGSGPAPFADAMRSGVEKSGIGPAILIILFCVALFLITLYLYVLMWIRTIIIMLLLILSPVAYAGLALPIAQIKDLVKKWWEEFIKWSFMGVGVVFLLVLTGVLISTIGSKVSPEGQALPGDEAGKTILNMIIAGIMLVITATYPLKMGGAAGGAMGKAGSFIGKQTAGRAAAGGKKLAATGAAMVGAKVGSGYLRGKENVMKRLEMAQKTPEGEQKKGVGAWAAKKAERTITAPTRAKATVAGYGEMKKSMQEEAFKIERNKMLLSPKNRDVKALRTQREAAVTDLQNSYLKDKTKSSEDYAKAAASQVTAAGGMENLEKAGNEEQYQKYLSFTGAAQQRLYEDTSRIPNAAKKAEARKMGLEKINHTMNTAIAKKTMGATDADLSAATASAHAEYSATYGPPPPPTDIEGTQKYNHAVTNLMWDKTAATDEGKTHCILNSTDRLNDVFKVNDKIQDLKPQQIRTGNDYSHDYTDSGPPAVDKDGYPIGTNNIFITR